MLLLTALSKAPIVAPVRERGLKYGSEKLQQRPTYVAPVRERGLKSLGVRK